MRLRTRRTWLTEVCGYTTGELRIDQVSDHALTLMTELPLLQIGDQMLVEHEDGTIKTLVKESYGWRPR